MMNESGMSFKKYEITPWNCDKQCFDPPLMVTLAEFLAETKAACARAKAIHATNVHLARCSILNSFGE